MIITRQPEKITAIRQIVGIARNLAAAEGDMFSQFLVVKGRDLPKKSNGAVLQQIIVALAFPIGLIVILLWDLRQEVRYWRIILKSILATGAGLLLFANSSSFFIHALTMLVTAGVLLTIRASRRVSLIAILGISVAMYVTFTVRIVAEIQEAGRLREEFPVVSLDTNLSYESKLSSGISMSFDSKVSTLSADADGFLKRLDSSRGGMRRNMLSALHREEYLSFVVANGFGPVRMLKARREDITLPEPSKEPFSPRPENAEPPTLIQRPFEMLSDVAELSTNDLAKFHHNGVVDFADERQWGYVAPRKKREVTGFAPHAFRRLSLAGVLRASGDYGYPDWRFEKIMLDEWQISHLDLVSLLKFDEARVYVSEHLPQMDELRNAETRSLDAFEQRALLQLRGGEDIVVEQGLNHIRMLGALRAANQCLDCHSVRRGDLLGAFSYLLDRKKPIPPPKHADQPVLLRIRHHHIKLASLPRGLSRKSSAIAP